MSERCLISCLNSSLLSAKKRVLADLSGDSNSAVKLDNGSSYMFWGRHDIMSLKTIGLSFIIIRIADGFLSEFNRTRTAGESILEFSNVSPQIRLHWILR